MQKRLSLLSVEGLKQARAEKNWMPFVHEGALHLVYQMTPLIVIRCSLPDGACVCVVPEGGCRDTQAVSKGVTARGGTPLTRVGEHLYFGLLHSTYRHHMIRAHMVLLSTAPWGWVTLGGPLPMPEGLPGCFEGQVPWDVQFPASSLLLGPRGDALLMGIHVRDAMSALIHVDLGGAAMPDILAEVTAVACEETGGEERRGFGGRGAGPGGGFRPGGSRSGGPGERGRGGFSGGRSGQRSGPRNGPRGGGAGRGRDRRGPGGASGGG